MGPRLGGAPSLRGRGDDSWCFRSRRRALRPNPAEKRSFLRQAPPSRTIAPPSLVLEGRGHGRARRSPFWPMSRRSVLPSNSTASAPAYAASRAASSVAPVPRDAQDPPAGRDQVALVRTAPCRRGTRGRARRRPRARGPAGPSSTGPGSPSKPARRTRRRFWIPRPRGRPRGRGRRRRIARAGPTPAAAAGPGPRGRRTGS